MKKALLSLAILVIGLSFVYDFFSEEVKEEYRRTQEKVVPQEIIGKIPSYFTYEGSEVLITYKPSGEQISLTYKNGKWIIVKSEVGDKFKHGKVMIMGKANAGAKLPGGARAGDGGIIVAIQTEL